jgi:hypothetical protein
LVTLGTYGPLGVNFLKFSCKKLNILCNFKVKYCKPQFVTSSSSPVAVLYCVPAMLGT